MAAPSGGERPSPTTRIVPERAEDVAAAVRATPRLLARGGASKPALSTPPAGAAILDLSAWSGIVEYEPAEYTVTAGAATPLAALDATLAAEGHYLPFDPPLAGAGATLGGTVAAGLAGSGRWRHGGVRDFVLGVTLVDGTGTIARGGGKVVKNAAGFDLPKLLVGSLGRLAVLLEITLKVFPRPRARLGIRLRARDRRHALATLRALAGTDWGLDALDLEPPATLLVRAAGERAGLERRFRRLAEALGDIEPEPLDDEATAAAFAAPADRARARGDDAVRVATAPARLEGLDDALEALGVARRHTVGGHLTWIHWPRGRDRGALDRVLRNLGLGGLALFDAGAPARLGVWPSERFLARIRGALDPDRRFPDLA